MQQLRPRPRLYMRLSNPGQESEPSKVAVSDTSASRSIIGTRLILACQDRFTTLESHLARLTLTGSQSDDRSSRSSVELSQRASSGQLSLLGDGDDDDDEDDRDGSDSPPLHSDHSTELHVFRNQVDMVDRYHGPSSLYVLCNHFRLRALASGHADEPGNALPDMLQNLCEIAGVTESFPLDGDHPTIHLLPKQQALAAVGHFFQHVDYATDVFVQSNLLANLERAYSQPMKPQDEIWAICFKAIVLLVLGKEVAAQAYNALFGDFARSVLPSRAALINPRLLTAPRLVNVQTLILLSVAAQQFDPHGWAELLFTHACMLARTMGLHHAHHLHSHAVADETLERAKVLRCLYSRDKSLCTTRGCISWLPSDDCNIASQLGVAVGPQASFLDRFQLATIQEDIQRLTSADARRKTNPATHLRAGLQRILEQLDQYERAFHLFDAEYSSRRALIPLEFLATRILALQHGSEPRYTEQLRSDASASCLLLLIAHGDKDRQVIDAFNSLTCPTISPPPQPRNSATTETSAMPFASVLDAFSVPAFFILLEGIVQPTGNGPASTTDLDLLRKVSACYTENTGRLQSNSYHRKVAWIFDRLLNTIDQFKQQPQQHLPESPVPPTSMAEMLLFNHSTPQVSVQSPMVDFSHIPDPKDLPNFSTQSTPPPGMSLPWDNWLSVASSLGQATPSAMADCTDGFGTAAPDFLTHMLGSPSQHTSNTSVPTRGWAASAAEPSVAPKRRRTHELDPSRRKPRRGHCL
ncbi:MAG: hypothetical protein Q9207_005165 [Kuettlingeria erythrocarpa]